MVTLDLVGRQSGWQISDRSFCCQALLKQVSKQFEHNGDDVGASQ